MFLRLSICFIVLSTLGITLYFVSKPVAAVSAASVAENGFCKNWDKVNTVGYLDEKIIGEASGLIISKKFKNRLYHINDSNNTSSLYLTDFAGKNTKSVKVKDFKPIDTEDLTYGKCPYADNYCLFIADIGDNRKERESVRIAIIPEEEDFDKKIKNPNIITLTYPDRPHNAEAIAFHPSGDLFIVTKEQRKKVALPAQIFKISKEQIKQVGNEPITMTLVGEIDVPFLTKQLDFGGQIVTGMDISADGKRFVLLTYSTIIEFNYDLQKEIPSVKAMKDGEDYKLLNIDILEGQEAISYLPDGYGIMYTTEFKTKTPPINTINCKD